jgi:NTP pyrophosphatase (non-canonical NTP hydrolase)
MRLADYNEFVKSTDQYKARPDDQRRMIAVYGLNGEIGSLASAIKKRLLGEDGQEGLENPSNEIVEELGDVIWYCFSLTQILGADRKNILVQNISRLRGLITGRSERSKKFQAALTTEQRNNFLKGIPKFIEDENRTFDDYQKLAYFTARTEGFALLEVCLSVLWKLGAELLWRMLPDSERPFNTDLKPRQPAVVLGDIAWHLAAIATALGLSLDKVVANNCEKVGFRSGESTPLHDEGREDDEKFPRQFEIAFLSISKDRARMYYNGAQLGDDLTDNNYKDDGYRFHDAMHLANVAHLGWSPVLRSFLGLKRKRDRKKDEVEDGARARIVEELVLKLIHAEGVRQMPPDAPAPARLFPKESHASFRLIKSLHPIVENLEVRDNKHWEWKSAILDGARIVYELSKEGQGTVAVDMVAHTLTFSPHMVADIRGAVVAIGSAMVDATKDTEALKEALTPEEMIECAASPNPSDSVIRTVAVKRAIFDAMKMTSSPADQLQMVRVTILDDGRVSVKATGSVLTEMWKRKIVIFKTTLSTAQNIVSCSAVAISDITVGRG